MLKSKKISLDNTISGLEDSLFTGASEKGTWARLFHPPVEGKLIRRFEGLDGVRQACKLSLGVTFIILRVSAFAEKCRNSENIS